MNNIPDIFWIVPLAAVIALAFGYGFYRRMKRESEGNDRMKEIAAHVRSGAMAYLKQQYKIVTIVLFVLAIFFAILAYGLGVRHGPPRFGYL